MLMMCRIVALDKRPGVKPMGIGETLCRALSKLVLQSEGDQVNAACSNIQFFMGLEAGREGSTHTIRR